MKRIIGHCMMCATNILHHAMVTSISPSREILKRVSLIRILVIQVFFRRRGAETRGSEGENRKSCNQRRRKKRALVHICTSQQLFVIYFVLIFKKLKKKKRMRPFAVNNWKWALPIFTVRETIVKNTLYNVCKNLMSYSRGIRNVRVCVVR